MPKLPFRQRVPELLDDPTLDPSAQRRALAGLARLNRFSRSVGVLWPPLRELARTVAPRALRVLDVATGSGDVPVGLARRARRRGIRLEVAGCDMSPTAVAEATRAAVGSPATFFTRDAVRDPLPAGYDVVTSSLFLHHLSDDDAVALLRRMKDAAGALVLVNDLTRSRFTHAAVWAACRLLSRSPVVRFDGPASVRSAFTRHEALALAGRAGLSGATVSGRFPCRFLLRWNKLHITTTKTR